MEDKFTSMQSVEYILEKVPEAQENYVLLILLYWTLFDNIAIPSEILKDILKKATSPESITRFRRMIKERNKIADKL